MSERMESIVGFLVEGTPIAQPRPRAVLVGGGDKRRAGIISAPRSHDVNLWKACCRYQATLAYRGAPLNQPLTLLLEFVMPRPAKRDGRKHRDDERYEHRKRPDLDNLIKAVKDALTGALWADDSVICGVGATKWVAAADEQPHVAIELCKPADVLPALSVVSDSEE